MKRIASRRIADLLPGGAVRSPNSAYQPVTGGRGAEAGRAMHEAHAFAGHRIFIAAAEVEGGRAAIAGSIGASIAMKA